MLSWYRGLNKPGRIVIDIVGVFIVLAIVAGIAGSPPEETKTATSSGGSVPSAYKPPPPPVDPAVEAANYKAACQPMEFRVLDKNPDSHAGEKYRVQGEVVQILEGDSSTDIRMDVTKSQYGSWSDTIYVTFPGKTPALEKSIINIYGEVVGKYSYKSQAGWDVVLPRIDAKYIDVVTQ